MFKKIRKLLNSKSSEIILPEVENVSIAEAVEIEERGTKMDIPGSLPLEIFHEVLMYLSPGDLYNTRNCCKKWRKHMLSFWKKKCNIECYFESEDDLNSKFYRNFVKQFSRWEGIYIYNSKLEHNWITQNYKEVIAHNLVEFQDFIYYFCNDILVVVTDKTISVFDYTTGVNKRFCQPILKGVEAAILEVKIIEDRLIIVFQQLIIPSKKSCFLGFSVGMVGKIWNVQTGKLLTELKLEPIPTVQRVSIYKDLIMMVTECHPSLYIFNIQKETFDYHRNCINSVCYYDDKIATGSNTGTILIMDLNYTELVEFNCCATEQKIDNMQMKGKYLVALSGGGEEGDYRHGCVWNIETNTKLYQIQQLAWIGLTIYLNENRLVYVTKSGPDKSAYKLCRLDSGECIADIEYGDAVTTNFFIIKGNVEDHAEIKLWSIKTGRLVADRDLLSPFCINYIGTSIPKSKLAFIHFGNVKSSKKSLRIIDFQAKIEI